MNRNAIPAGMETADFGPSLSGITLSAGRILGGGATVGNGLEGWAPGAFFIQVDAGSTALWYRNDGTKTAASWTAASPPGSGLWAGAPTPADPQWQQIAHQLFDDFYELDTTATVGRWAAFNVGTGTTVLADDVAGGELVMTCQATTDDACEQLNGVSAPFLFAAGKTLWYEARVKQVGDVQSEVSFGLCALSEDLTAVADVYPADGVCFAHQDASMALALTASKGGVNTGAVAGVHTMVTNVYATYGLLIDGLTSITPYIDGVAGTPATATFVDDESLCPYFLVRNGDGTTQQKLHVDYVKVLQLR